MHTSCPPQYYGAYQSLPGLAGKASSRCSGTESPLVMEPAGISATGLLKVPEAS